MNNAGISQDNDSETLNKGSPRRQRFQHESEEERHVLNTVAPLHCFHCCGCTASTDTPGQTHTTCRQDLHRNPDCPAYEGSMGSLEGGI